MCGGSATACETLRTVPVRQLLLPHPQQAVEVRTSLTLTALPHCEPAKHGCLVQDTLCTDGDFSMLAFVCSHTVEESAGKEWRTYKEKPNKHAQAVLKNIGGHSARPGVATAGSDVQMFL